MILVIDDDPEIRRVMMHLLSRGGLECVEATGGEEGLVLAKKLRPQLCLIDVMMPKLDGVSLCRQLRADDELEGMTIVMVSAVGEEQVMMRAFEAGADDYIVKPFKSLVLLHKVQSWYRHHQVRPLDSVLDLAPGTEFDGRYKILSQLGRGGMAVVYSARQEDAKRDVALKVLHGLGDEPDNDSSRRFRREVAALSLIRHPNVVRLYDSGHFSGYFYYAMELMEGESARALMEREGALPLARAAAVINDIADGLEAAHQAGFLHRDIKLANIFLDRYGRAKLGDFGIALPVQTMASDRITEPSVILGTLDYLSPEQIMSVRLDVRTDVYSLGLCLFLLLTGKHPYANLSQDEFLRCTLTYGVPDPSTLHPGVCQTANRLVRQACAPDAQDRFPTAKAFADALREVR